MEHLHHGKLLRHKAEQAIDAQAPDDSPEGSAEWEKPAPEGYMPCHSIYVAFLKCQRCGDDCGGRGQGMSVAWLWGQLEWDRAQPEAPSAHGHLVV